MRAGPLTNALRLPWPRAGSGSDNGGVSLQLSRMKWGVPSLPPKSTQHTSENSPYVLGEAERSQDRPLPETHWTRDHC